MSEHEFWVRPKEFPPFVAPPVRTPVVFHESSQTLTDSEIKAFKKTVEKELQRRNPNLYNKREKCLKAIKDSEDTSFVFLFIISTLIVFFEVFKFWHFLTTNEKLKITVYSILHILLFIFSCIYICLGFITVGTNRKEKKELVGLEKEVSNFIDSEYTKAQPELIAVKTYRLNAELRQKECIQEKAAFTRAENAHKKICEQITQKCDKLCQEAVSIYTQYTKKLAGINDALARLDASIIEVEQTFKDNRYGPFWEAVEECFEILGECDGRFKKFREIQVDQYYAIRSDANSLNNLPHLPVPDFDIQAPQKILVRLNALVRKAQSIIDFASIYEMRATRKEIVHGFKNLSATVEGVGFSINQTIVSTSLYLSSELASLGRSIEYSLEAASERISSSVIDVNEANIEALERLNDSVTEASSEMLELAERSESSREEEFERLREQAEKQTDTLDDIRRGRIPIGPNPRKRLTRPK